MKTVVARIDLGFTRVAGYILYDSETYEFKEMTPVPVAALAKKGCVNGLVIGNDGELLPDVEGWNMQNIKIRSGVGNYRDYNAHTNKGDTVYSVVRAVSVNNKVILYEVINNRCARMFVTPTVLLGIEKLYLVGGVKISGNDIALCKGVIKEDYTDAEWFEVGVKVVSKNKLETIIANEANIAQDTVNSDEISAPADSVQETDFTGDHAPSADVESTEEMVSSIENAQTMEELFGDTAEISVPEEVTTPDTDNKAFKTHKKHHKK